MRFPYLITVLLAFNLFCVNSFSDTNKFSTALIPKGKVLVLSQDDLFRKSNYGKAISKFFKLKQEDLLIEGRKIEQQFVLEERKLTEKRLILQSEDFQKLADDFDRRVEQTRKSRAEKDRKLQQSFIKWKKKFAQIVLPIVRDIMTDTKAPLVVDTSTRGLIYDQKIDITEIVTQKLNEDFTSYPGKIDKILNNN